MDLHVFDRLTRILIDLGGISVIYGLRARQPLVPCGDLWRALATQSRKLWPQYNIMLSPIWMPGWLDGWMGGWLAGWVACWP